MNKEFEYVLSRVLSDSQLHARLINTFSYLEYIGFRKIVKSQHAIDMTEETLSHALEEGRHAFRLKKYAVQIGGKNFGRYEQGAMLCPREADDYFQGLDAAVNASCGGIEANRLTYLYVTRLIEVRALSIYGVYQSAVGAESPVRGILIEEDGHLAQVSDELRRIDREFSDRLLQFETVESELFERYLLALKREVLHGTETFVS